MFKHISQILKANQLLAPVIKDVIISLLPEGKIEGNSYVALNPTRTDKNLGSFRLDLSTAKWIDFANGDKGKDIVSLCAYVKGLSQYQASQYLLKAFGYFNNKYSNQNNNFLQLSPPKVAKVPKVVNYNSADTVKFATKIWDECKSASNSPVAEYLSSRGIVGSMPESIRYHPKLYHSITKEHYHAMVSLITKGEQNEVIGIHRTYLSYVNGKIIKAPIKPNKMILGSAKGGAVRLGFPDKKLVIAEGIETALSIMQATKLSVWAVLSASNMQNIILPSPRMLKQIIIAADNDEAGMKAARKLASRLLNDGYITRIAMPPKVGSDFNDLLINPTEEK
jgi:hypothetical protein